MEDTLFRIEASLLSAASPIFRHMLALPVGPGPVEGETEDFPITLPLITAKQFQAFVAFLMGELNGVVEILE